MIDALIARLDASASSFKTVEHAFTMTPVDNLEQDTPAIFVYPGAETVGANQLDLGVSQQWTRQAHLYIVCPSADLKALRQEIFGVLLGWQPEQSYTELTFLSGDIKDIKGEYLWWIDTFITTTLLRQT